MSEPEFTVRGLLSAIYERLGGGASAELLTEIRFLNRALFGATGAEPGEAPPTDLWRQTFTATRVNWGNDQLENDVPLARLLVGDGNGQYKYSAGASLADLRATLYEVQLALGSRVNNQTAVGYLADAASKLNLLTDAMGEPVEQYRLVRLVYDLTRLISQVWPLAEGNDIYSTLIAINDNARRSADCCEEGSGGGGGDGNPPPASEPENCTWPGTWLRVGNWVDEGIFNNGGADSAQGLWAPWDFSSVPGITEFGTEGGVTVYQLDVGPNDVWDFCVYHDYTGEQAPFTASFDFATTPEEAVSFLYTPSAQYPTIYSYGFSLSPATVGEGTVYFAFYGFFPVGATPGRNSFVKIRKQTVS